MRSGHSYFIGFPLGVAGLVPSLTLPWKLTPLLGWVLGAVLCVGNPILAWMWFRSRVRELDTFRPGDIEVPDATVMAQQSVTRARRVPVHHG